MVKNSIVLVPFPFDDFSEVKVRPALCLTGKIGKYESVIIAFISSRIPDEILESDLVIEKGSDIWVGTGLTADSVVRLHKIVSIPAVLIKRKLGVLNSVTGDLIKEKLFQMFDIGNENES